LYQYLGRPLEELLIGEPLAPLVIKCVDKSFGREMIIRLKKGHDIWEVTVAHEMLVNIGNRERN
jgi:hypothetical protein